MSNCRTVEMKEEFAVYSLVSEKTKTNNNSGIGLAVNNV